MFTEKQQLFIHAFVKEFPTAIDHLWEVERSRALEKKDIGKKTWDTILNIAQNAGRAIPGVSLAILGAKAVMDAHHDKERSEQESIARDMYFRQLRFEVLLKQVAEKAAREYYSVIENCTESSIIRFAVVGVDRSLHYMVEGKLPFTIDNLIAGFVSGRSGSGVSGIGNQRIYFERSNLEDATAEGAYKRGGLCYWNGSEWKYFVSQQSDNFVNRISQGFRKHTNAEDIQTTFIKEGEVDVPKYGFRVVNRETVEVYQREYGYIEFNVNVPCSARDFIEREVPISHTVTPNDIETYKTREDRSQSFHDFLSQKYYGGQRKVIAECHDESLRGIDFSGTSEHQNNFDYVDFSSADLSECFFNDCSFSGANLRNAIFNEASGRNISFNRASLDYAKFINGKWIVLDFSQACGNFVTIRNSTLNQLIQLGAKLNEIDMRDNRHVSDIDILNEPVSIENIQERLKNRYREQSKISLLDEQQSEIGLDQLFVNLAFVREEKKRKKPFFRENEKHDGEESKKQDFKDHNKSDDRSSIAYDYEDSDQVRQPVNIEDLFKPLQKNGHPITPHKILLLGPAGIGKTTLSKYVAYQWACGELFSQFEWVFLFSLKKITSCYKKNKIWTMDEVLYIEFLKEFGMNEEQAQWFWHSLQENKVLFILDGYDEVAHEEHPVIEEVLLRKAPNYLLTSRPYAGAVSRVDAVFENIGFTDNNITRYIDQFYQKPIITSEPSTAEEDEEKQSEEDEAGQRRADRLKTWLNVQPDVKRLCHVPINLELLCITFQDDPGVFSNDTTVTELYQRMIDRLWLRFVQKKTGEDQFRARYRRVDMEQRLTFIDEHAGKLRNFLRELAFNGLQIGPILPGEMVGRLMGQNSYFSGKIDFTQLNDIGFLKTIGNHIDSLKNDYYFIHLSFQEHFAAEYIATNFDQPSLRTFWQEHKYDPTYQLMLAHAAGLLKNNPERLNRYFECLLSPPRDLFGFCELQLLIRCGEETGWPDHLVIRDRLGVYIGKWVSQLIEIDYYDKFETIRRSFFAMLSEYPKVGSLVRIKENSLIDYLLMALRDEDYKVRPRASRALVALKEIIPEDRRRLVISGLLTDLSDRDFRVRLRAAEALGALKEIIPENQRHLVIEGLLTALRDKESWGVRSNAAEALVALKEIIPEDQRCSVVSSLLMALSNEDHWLRSNAAQVLGKLKEIIPEDQRHLVIEGLLTALKDKKHWAVQSNVAKALGALKEIIPENQRHLVIEGLLTALREEDCWVQSSATGALAALKETIPENQPRLMIEGLLRALSDGEHWVRSSAARGLGELKGIIPEDQRRSVIDGLLTALRNEDCWVRPSAARALVALKEIIPEDRRCLVIDGLLTALSDEHDWVRSGAAQALVALKGIIPEDQRRSVIDGLLTALRDEDFGVLSNATRALAALKETIPEDQCRSVISSFLMALSDRDFLVRSSAAQALGALAEIIPEDRRHLVIEGLLTALSDEDHCVRSSAARGLGALKEIIPENQRHLVIDGLLTVLRDEEFWVLLSDAAEPLRELFMYLLQYYPSVLIGSSLAAPVVSNKLVTTMMPIWQTGKNTIHWIENKRHYSAECPNASQLVKDIESCRPTSARLTLPSSSSWLSLSFFGQSSASSSSSSSSPSSSHVAAMDI